MAVLSGPGTRCGSPYIPTAAEPPGRPPNETSSQSQLPEFVTSPEAREVTSRTNQPAHLHCQVANLGDRSVSWLRARDLHILTTGLFTFTTDKRFVAFNTGTTWTLKLLAPRVNDSGAYLCQVSTEPRISQSFTLTVKESRAYIASNRELFVKAGSSISLSCTLTHNISQLYWLHNGSVIHYTGEGWGGRYWLHIGSVIHYTGEGWGAIIHYTGEGWGGRYWLHIGSVIHYTGEGWGAIIHYTAWSQEDQPVGLGRVVATTAGRTSSLLVSRAGLTDSGQYTCQPTDAEADHVMVHVLTGEHPAAMQHGSASPARSAVLLTSALLMTTAVCVR
ncbi:Zwei Ig domain protein zig-8 [Amphibalanus amphitrite]|uniref:Zwei Ig domain protein zig-8 n=1 Tax=Amphibalanus amphitrite TaxID=1232801 RepID=A0A6A4VGH9_AMPAM|nr:Zwei Ig domain protein zig-8 [Amphibalanus amphitrite]